jgi:CelD/BcsL family acetyltransferase involved in cellulose biosynthesis
MLKKLRAKAESTGPLELQVHTELSSDELHAELRLAFEIEDRSWKGAAGTSILRSPGKFDFFHRMAAQLFEWNQLELYFLRHNGRAIAFDYCYAAKGTMGSHKIGYDEEFRDLGPSQLLRLLQLESWQAQPERKLLDTLGILDEAKAKWCTRTYEVSRLTCSTGGLLGGAGMFAFQHLKPLAAKLRGRKPVADDSAGWEAGAARCVRDRQLAAAEEVIGA